MGANALHRQKRPARRAESLAGPGTRRGCATRRWAFLAAARRERAAWAATLRCPPLRSASWKKASELATHHQRVLAIAAARRRRVVLDAPRDGGEALGLVERDRRMVADAHFEEQLLGAQPPRVVDELREQRTPEARPARIGYHRQVEQLSFAGPEHQHAIRDDALAAHAQA